MATWRVRHGDIEGTSWRRGGYVMGTWRGRHGDVEGTSWRRARYVMATWRVRYGDIEGTSWLPVTHDRVFYSPVRLTVSNARRF